jgi:hypothetical protein
VTRSGDKGRPPPLAKLGARKERLEAERETLFKWWREALEAAEGNVTRAGVMVFPDLPPARAKSRGEWYTRRLGLAGYAAELRVQAGQRPRGRPWPTTSPTRTPARPAGSRRPQNKSGK